MITRTLRDIERRAPSGYTETFAEIIRDQVTTRVAIEAQAQAPRGLTNRSFEAITGELIMANWDRLAAGPGTVDQIIARMCGTEKPCPRVAPNGARTWTTRSGHRRARH